MLILETPTRRFASAIMNSNALYAKVSHCHTWWVSLRNAKDAHKHATSSYRGDQIIVDVTDALQHNVRTIAMASKMFCRWDSNK